MIQIIHDRRYDAYVKIMESPDPADLPHRGSVLKYEGDPERMSWLFPRLVTAWAQYKLLEKETV